MTHDVTPTRCTAPDPFEPGRCPLPDTNASGFCGAHQVAAEPEAGQASRSHVEPSWPEAPILAEMRWVATEARVLRVAGDLDPARVTRFQERRRALLDALKEW